MASSTSKTPSYKVQTLSEMMNARFGADTPATTPSATPTKEKNPGVIDLDSTPAEQEMKKFMDDLRDRKLEIPAEEKEKRAKIAQMEREARQLYRDQASRAEWLSLANQIGQSLVKLGAANAGLAAGADVSGLKLDGPLDLSAQLKRHQEDYMGERQDLNLAKTELLNDRLRSEELENTKMGLRFKDIADRRGMEALSAERDLKAKQDAEIAEKAADKKALNEAVLSNTKWKQDSILEMDKALKEAAKIDQKRADELGVEYRKDATILKANAALSGAAAAEEYYILAKDTASAGKATGAADIGLLNSAQQVFDPNQGVKDNDVTLIQGSGGPVETMKALWNSVSKGGTLSPAVRTALIEAVRVGVRGRLEAGNARRADFQDMAREMKISDKTVLGKELTPGAKTPKEIKKIPDMTDTDRAANQWLKENPDDPRAPAAREELKRRGQLR